jgi:hypothetical protein
LFIISQKSFDAHSLEREKKRKRETKLEQISHDKKIHAMSIKYITVKELQIESIQDFDLLKNLAVVLEKRYLIDQQEAIQLLVLVLVQVQVGMVANHHHAKQEFLLHVQLYQDALHYYQL